MYFSLEKAQYQLTYVEDYNIFKDSPLKIDGIDDWDQFNNTVSALEVWKKKTTLMFIDSFIFRSQIGCASSRCCNYSFKQCQFCSILGRWKFLRLRWCRWHCCTTSQDQRFIFHFNCDLFFLASSLRVSLGSQKTLEEANFVRDTLIQVNKNQTKSNFRLGNLFQIIFVCCWYD